jgi:hypothetical protein
LLFQYRVSFGGHKVGLFLMNTNSKVMFMPTCLPYAPRPPGAAMLAAFCATAAAPAFADSFTVSSGTGTTAQKLAKNQTGTLALAGSELLSSASALVLAGGTLDTRRAETGTQTFASFSLTDNSAIEPGDAKLTFDGPGSIVGGKDLSLSDGPGSPNYLLRFVGDFMHDADFLELMRHTTIDDIAVRYRFDGTCTRVLDASDVPEPASMALLLGGVGLHHSYSRGHGKATANGYPAI